MRHALPVLSCIALSLSFGCGGSGAGDTPDFGGDAGGGAGGDDGVAPDGGGQGGDGGDGGGDAGGGPGDEGGQGDDGGPGDDGSDGGVEPECDEGATEDEPCGLNDRGASTRACTDGKWSEFGECVDPDECEDGAEDGQACGFNERGGQLRVCVEGAWAEFGECDDPDECLDGDSETQVCGLNERGEQIRECEEGAWGEFEACVDPDECEDDATEDAACGFNDNGTMSRTCVEGAWGEYGECDDPDECENGVEEDEACGLNGRGLRSRECADGVWGDFRVCIDPDFCLDGSEHNRDCGINDRGVSTRICEEGSWGEFGECVDPDECEDDLEDLQDCGLNLRGEQVRVCVEGAWGDFDECDDPDDCVIDEVENEACGHNGNGERSRTCTDGAWEDFTLCEDPDDCRNGDTEEEACGLNRRSQHTRTCADGQWGDFEGCDDPDECVDNALDLRDCGPDGAGGQQARTCVTGHWGPWRACVDGDGAPLVWDGALQAFDFDLPHIGHLGEQNAAIRSVFELGRDFDFYGVVATEDVLDMVMGAYVTAEDDRFRSNQAGGNLANMERGFLMAADPDAPAEDGELLGVHRRRGLMFVSRDDVRYQRFDRRAAGLMRLVIGHRDAPEGDWLRDVRWDGDDGVNPEHRFEICEPDLFEGALAGFDIAAGDVAHAGEDNAAIRTELPDAEFRVDLDLIKPGDDSWLTFGVYDAGDAGLFDDADARGGSDAMATAVSVDLQAGGGVRVGGAVEAGDLAVEDGDLWSLLGLGDEVAVLRNDVIVHTAPRPGGELHMFLGHHNAAPAGGFRRCNFVTGAAVGDGTPLPECRNDDLEERDCGLNDRGVQERTCVDRRWTPWGECADPDICVDDAVDGQACGFNDRGVEERTCVEGRWGPFGACDDPDECEDADFQERVCGFNNRGDQNRTCTAGRWEEWTVCDDPDVCQDGSNERRACGPGDAGLQERSCVTGQWVRWRACLDDQGGPLLWEGRVGGFDFDFPHIRHHGQINAAIRSVPVLSGDFDIYGTASVPDEFFMLLGAYAAEEDGEFNDNDPESGTGNMVRGFILDGQPTRMNPDVADGEVFGVHRRRGLMFFSRDDGRFRRFVRRSPGDMRALIGHHNTVSEGAWEDLTILEGGEVSELHRWHTCEPELWQGGTDGFDLPGGRILHAGESDAAIFTGLPDADFRLDVGVSMVDGEFWSTFGVYPSAEAEQFDAADARGGMDGMGGSLSVDLQTTGNGGIRVGGDLVGGALHPEGLADDDDWTLMADGGDLVVLRNEEEVARAARPEGALDLVFGHHGAAAAGGFIDCQFVTGAAVGDFSPLPECQNGDTEAIRCGFNDRGRSERTCENARWTPFGECADPDECVDDDTFDQACGWNERGTETQTCVIGEWSEFGECDDPDECEIGTSEDQACGLNSRGTQTKTCDDGQWSEFGACDDPDECLDDDTEERVCGADDAGTQGRTCAAGQWRPWRVCLDADGNPTDWTGRLAGFSFDGADIGQVGDNAAAIRSVASLDGDFDVYGTVHAVGDFQMVMGLYPAARDGAFDPDDAFGAIDELPVYYLLDGQPGIQAPELVDGERIGMHRRRNLFFISRDDAAYLRHDERSPAPVRALLGHHAVAADGDAWEGVEILQGAETNQQHQFHVCEAEIFEGATDSFTLGGGRALQADAANGAIRAQLPQADFRVDVKVRQLDGEFWSVFGVYPSAEDDAFLEDDALGGMDRMDGSLFVDLQTTGNGGIKAGDATLVADLHPNNLADGDYWSLLGQDGDIVVLRNDVEQARIQRPADDLKLVFSHHGAGPAGGFVECRWATGAAMGPDADRMAICDEEDVQERGCALGDAGAESRTCVDGGWEPWTACLGPDGGPLIWEGRAAGFSFDGDDIGHAADDDANAAIRTHAVLAGDFDLTGTVQLGDAFLLNLGAYAASEDATFNFDDAFGGMASMTDSFFLDGQGGGGARAGGGDVDPLHGGIVVGDVWGVHRRRSTVFLSKNGGWFATMATPIAGDMRGVIGHHNALGDGIWQGVTILEGDDVDARHSSGACERELFTGNLDGFTFGDGRLDHAGAAAAAIRADLPEADFSIDVTIDQDPATRFLMTMGVFSAADDGAFDPNESRGGLRAMGASISVDLSNDFVQSSVHVGGNLCSQGINFLAGEGAEVKIIGRNGTVDVQANGISLINFCQLPPPPAGALKVMFGHNAGDPAGGFSSCGWKTGALLPN